MTITVSRGTDNTTTIQNASPDVAGKWLIEQFSQELAKWPIYTSLHFAVTVDA